MSNDGIYNPAPEAGAASPEISAATDFPPTAAPAPAPVLGLNPGEVDTLRQEVAALRSEVARLAASDAGIVAARLDAISAGVRECLTRIVGEQDAAKIMGENFNG